MSFPTLDRRTIVKGGAIYAGALVLAGRAVQAEPTSSASTQPAKFSGPLIGWLIVAADGRNRLTIFEMDARSLPERQVLTIPIGDSASLAGAVREASDAALHAVASLQGVSAADCTFMHDGIRHAKSGTAIPFSIWVDFA